MPIPLPSPKSSVLPGVINVGKSLKSKPLPGELNMPVSLASLSNCVRCLVKGVIVTPLLLGELPAILDGVTGGKRFLVSEEEKVGRKALGFGLRWQERTGVGVLRRSVNGFSLEEGVRFAGVDLEGVLKNRVEGEPSKRWARSSSSWRAGGRFSLSMVVAASMAAVSLLLRLMGLSERLEAAMLESSSDFTSPSLRGEGNKRRRVGLGVSSSLRSIGLS